MKKAFIAAASLLALAAFGAHAADDSSSPSTAPGSSMTGNVPPTDTTAAPSAGGTMATPGGDTSTTPTAPAAPATQQ